MALFHSLSSLDLHALSRPYSHSTTHSPYPNTTLAQITDLTQALLPVSNLAGDAQYTGFVGASATSQPMLMAFLNGGFLLPSDTGLDLRVVSTDGASSIQFQWKTSSQKVRVAAFS